MTTITAAARRMRDMLSQKCRDGQCAACVFGRMCGCSCHGR